MVRDSRGPSRITRKPEYAQPARSGVTTTGSPSSPALPAGRWRSFIDPPPHPSAHSGLQPPQEREALSRRLERAPARGRIRVEYGVLLEHVPAIVALRLEPANDLPDPTRPLPQRPIKTLLHRLVVGELAPPHAIGEAGVHVLEMDVADPAVRPARDLQGVRPRDRQVADVEADPGVRRREQTLHVARPFDYRAVVGVQGQLEAVPAGDRARPREAARQGGPLGVGELEAGLVPVAARDRRQHEHRRSPFRQGSRLLFDRGELALADRLDVEDGGHEARDQAQVVTLQQAPQGGGVLGEEALRAQLGGGEPEAAGLGENALGRHLVSPPRRLADTPRDGRPRHAEEERGPFPCLFRSAMVGTFHKRKLRTRVRDVKWFLREAAGGPPSRTWRARPGSRSPWSPSSCAARAT